MKTAQERLRLAQTFIGGLAFLLLALSLPAGTYNRDFRQDYLSARALRDGVDIFTPTSDLAARYFPVVADGSPHLNLHPPLLTLVTVPFSFIPYEVLFLLWLAVNAAVLINIGRWLGLSFHGSVALAAWPPAWWALLEGQYELVLLALAMGGWRDAARGRLLRAGIWLGLATAIKFYPVLFLVPFAARRQFRVLLGVAGAFAMGQALSLLAAGPLGLVRYYLEVLPQATNRYVYIGLNTSPYGAFLRVFGGAEDVEPLVSAPHVVLPATMLLSILGFAALLRLSPEAAPVATLVAMPVVRGFQGLFALPQIVGLLRRSDLRTAALLASVAASFTLPLVNLVVLGLAKGEVYLPSPAIGVLGNIQTAGYLSLLLLSIRSTFVR